MPNDADTRLAELETLYRSSFLSFFRLCVAITDDEELARDAVQEAFAAAIHARRRFRGKGSLEAWVWRIVVNAARKARRRRTVGLHEGRAELAAANGRLEADERAVRELVARLPEQQRLAVFLRYYAGLDYRGIAEALGVQTGTVSATLNHAHASLRRTLEEEEG